MIICGTRVFTKMLGYVNGIKVCQQCNHAGRFMVKCEILWATLFWIPILPIWFQYHVVCPNCNMRYKIKRKEVFQLLSSPEQL